MIDVNRLLAMAFEDANATEYTPVPEGEYTGLIDRFEFRIIKQGTPDEKAILRLMWNLEDPDGRIKAITNREQNAVPQDLWLDMTPEGNLDMGTNMNVQLGRLREMFGQNKKGERWSFARLNGNIGRVLVTHRTDINNGKVYGEVKSVTKL